MLFTILMVAFAPLPRVWAHDRPTPPLPLLLHATAEELALGLEKGDFTSVDLVHVRKSFVGQPGPKNTTTHTGRHMSIGFGRSTVLSTW